MSSRTVLVAHPEALTAEALAAALARFPGLVPVGVTTDADELVAMGVRAQAAAVDGRLPGARDAAARLRRLGVRVVLIEQPTDGAEDEGIRVPLHAPVSRLAAALAPESGAVDGSRGLTRRERQVLTLVAKGMAGKQVARLLGISPKTVEQHKTRIFEKLGVHNQAAAVAVVAARGSAAWIPSSI
ncbi:MAG TPA: helix-turn-helix transcriptional regulator [Actinomycetota bacterium]|nr:helix-turn-helix transcriptional regulator [Actinomycetota bacterium]